LSIKTHQNKPIGTKSLWEIFKNHLKKEGIEQSSKKIFPILYEGNPCGSLDVFSIP
jgi:hypothetical protein